MKIQPRQSLQIKALPEMLVEIILFDNFPTLTNVPAPQARSQADN
jgi:hypothetical protein